MGANLYGVANPLALPAFGTTIGGVNVSCPAGSETNCIAIVTNPPISQGIYFPCCTAKIDVLLGATPPTGLIYSTRIGAGADFSSSQVAAAELVASATISIYFNFLGFGTLLRYPTGPLTINVALNPGSQPCTALNSWSYAYAWWARAADQ